MASLLAIDQSESEFPTIESSDSSSTTTPTAQSSSASQILPIMPLLPEVLCADPDFFYQLLDHISAWRLLPSNWISDLRSPRSGWTGTLPAHYGSSLERTKLLWVDARKKFLDRKTRGITRVKEKETRDLLLRVLWFVKLELGPELLGEKMHIAQLKHAMVVGTDGPGTVLVRVMYWVMARMRDVKFRNLDRNNAAARQDFWFDHLDPVAIFWILAYLRDAIDFEWLFDATGHLSTENTSQNFRPKVYTAQDTKLASSILYMVRIRLVFAAEVVFVFMIDGQREPFKGMKFSALNQTTASTARIWKNCVETFTSILVARGPFVNVPVDEWPVRDGYDEKVAMYETRFMATVQ